MSGRLRILVLAGASALAVVVVGTVPLASGASSSTFLGPLSTVKTLASTTPANGDENPYSVSVAPVSAGKFHKGDILVDNFNAKSNDQGTGSTIVDVTPSGKASLFAAIPKNLASCPGGVGLSTAQAILSTGWVIVGSTPSTKGTVATSGAGCLIVLSSSGQVAETISGPKIDGPWDMATIDHGSSVTLLVTNTLFGVKAAAPKTVNDGTLLRINLSIASGQKPRVTSETVVATGLAEQASASAFVLGPTGVAVVGSTAYIAERTDNDIVAVPSATTRTTPEAAPTVVSRKGELHQPIAMVSAPNGDLLVANGLNGDVVEVTTKGKQVSEFAIDPDPAQSPPGSGDLFGIAVAPSGHALYFAKDDTNTLAELS